MKEFKDLTGMKFGRWSVLELTDKTNRHYDRYWLCVCECEDKTTRPVAEPNLLRGKSKSCGCLSKEISIINIQRYNIERIPNNVDNSTKLENIFPHYKRIKSIYDGMRKRCYSATDINYKNYGRRGISICDEWIDDFMNFYNWSINNGYQEGLTIDRIDNDGNYEASNCRWTTMKEQCYNKSNTIHITLDNETKTILEWSEISGLSWSVLWQRYSKSHHTTKEMLFKPQKHKIKIMYKGQEKTLVELSQESGIGVETLRWRFKHGYKDDDLVRPADRWYVHKK